MIGDMGERLWEEMVRSERQRSMEWEEHREEIIEAAAQDMAGRSSGASEGSHPEDGALEIARSRLASEDEEKMLQKVYIAKGPIEVVKKALWTTVIRRTAKSRDSCGDTVLELPPYLSSIVWSPFSLKEQEVMAQLNAAHTRAKDHRPK
jgi:hypothetical protein